VLPAEDLLGWRSQFCFSSINLPFAEMKEIRFDSYFFFGGKKSIRSASLQSFGENTWN
jgi:hypothetical protein